MTDDLEQVREQLLRSAFLFDDPNTYRAGVEDALALVEARQEDATPAA